MTDKKHVDADNIENAPDIETEAVKAAEVAAETGADVGAEAGDNTEVQAENAGGHKEKDRKERIRYFIQEYCCKEDDGGKEACLICFKETCFQG